MSGEWVDVLAIAAIAFGGALIYGITGFGSSLFTIPLATHFIPLPFALALYSILDLSLALRLGLTDPRNAVRTEWIRIVPFMVVGTIAGVTLLVHLPRAVSMLCLGLFILSMAVSTFVRASALRSVSQAWAMVAGVAGGVASTLFGAGGPPYAIYLSRRPLSKEQYRATLGMCSIFSISMRVIAFLLTGLLLSLKPWLWALAAIPASFAGMWTATRLFHRMSRDHLMRAVGVVLACSGVSLLIRAAMTL